MRVMRRLLGISVSGVYAWRERVPSARQIADVALSAKIRTIHRRSRETYGAPRVHAELAQEHGCRMGRKHVARPMRAAGLQGVRRNRFVRTSVREPQAAPALDLMERHFQAAGPDRL